MKPFLRSAYHFFPVQLLLLHLRKYQVLLLFWLILYATINGTLMKIFGADALLLAPEYLGSVNVIGASILGLALGVFVMSWNITTFILHSKRFKFLATTKKPFLKYCINNALIPLLFLIYFLFRLYRFNDEVELMKTGEILSLMGGVLGGFILVCFLSFAYFFGADLTINRTIAPLISDPVLLEERVHGHSFVDRFGLKVNSYLSGGLKIKQPRIVRHYNNDYIDLVFKRHHLAAMVSIVLAFLFLVIIGFFLENRYFEMPAAASILILFAILVAVIGALTYFLKSWSLPIAIVLIVAINFLYQKEIIDPRNKAYGLDYTKKDLRPAYTKEALKKIAATGNVDADRRNMLEVLSNWKRKQGEEKPLMVCINVSGGGLRSAAFVMNTLQKIDSMCGGLLMQKTFLISGASGGMLAATYYRELYRRYAGKQIPTLNNPVYLDYIARDLLNPVFTSMIARDMFAPSQKFKVDNFLYVKDRGYAFEKKLSDNTYRLLDMQFKDLERDEHLSRIPLIIFNSTIKRDGRKLLISTQPLSFMSKPYIYQNDTSVIPDAVDFGRMFHNLQPMNLRLLTALRMNATFPYVLPNVWLPSYPVIDVMDAGLRDNFGQETTLRFLQNFDEWMRANTRGVMIIQLRDRPTDNWQNPFETKSLTDMLVNPATMLQHNWNKLQDYFQADQYSYFQASDTFYKRYSIMYMPEKPDKTAALNFHLSGREKRDVIRSFYHPANKLAIEKLSSEFSVH